MIGTRVGIYEVVAELGRGGPPPLARMAGELRRGLAIAQATQSPVSETRLAIVTNWFEELKAKIK